jgi:hypothetical protein
VFFHTVNSIAIFGNTSRQHLDIKSLKNKKQKTKKKKKKKKKKKTWKKLPLPYIKLSNPQNEKWKKI